MAINNPGSFLFPPLMSVLIIAGIFFFSTIDGEDFTIEEATIEEIQRAFTAHKLTSRQLVDFYLDRIETLNPLLRSVVEVNPDARDQADEADRERTSSPDRSSLGELHGIPVLLKDTIATKDKLNTTAGSYALLGSVVPRDAGVVERLRTAGAVILGKASLTEWYSFRSLGQIPNGWCARAGQAAVSPLSLSL
jgi:amidase